MPKIVHVEINSDAPETTAKFYAEVFGWIIHKKWVGTEDYWLARTGMSDEKGIDGGLRKRFLAGATMVPTIEVSSFDEFSTRILTQGGKALTPKRSITATGYLAYFEDPDGNVFAILERDPSVQ